MDEESRLKNRPYSYHLTMALLRRFEIINLGQKTRSNILDIRKYFFKAEIFYFNWIENLSGRQVLYFMFLIMFAKVFHKKITWTHHNVHPHQAESRSSKIMMYLLKKYADYIIIHTKESYNLLGSNKSDNRIIYFFHPFFNDQKISISKTKAYDLLIWGTVRKSKGLHSFFDFLKSQNLLNTYKIKVVGEFPDQVDFIKFTKQYDEENLTVENKYLNMQELDDLHSVSRFIFFPYNGSSTLNSGALITSLPKGVPIIGPQIGAFKELGALSLIYNYTNFQEVINLLNHTPNTEHSSIKDPEQFIKKHNWNDFADHIATCIQ